jgi:hypothetical protein
MEAEISDFERPLLAELGALRKERDDQQRNFGDMEL